MRTWRKTFVYLLTVTLIIQIAWTPRTQAVDLPTILDQIKRPIDHVFNRKKPVTQKDRSVERLAKEIDWLENHIEKFGTIVPKQPDVWGEARMMRHRQQYETEIAKRFSEEKFKNTIQAAIRRSDQSLVSAALTIGNAVDSEGKPVNNPAVTLLNSNGAITNLERTAKADLKLGDFGLTDKGTDKIGLEPTIDIDQLSRYLNHINHLRRINEGDDTADTPGYALNLVRIPVSVLPGKRTRKGYGAEITVTVEPYLTDELLPSTFRNLVINDVVDQLALLVLKNLEDEKTLLNLQFLDKFNMELDRRQNVARFKPLKQKQENDIKEQARKNEALARQQFRKRGMTLDDKRARQIKRDAWEQAKHTINVEAALSALKKSYPDQFEACKGATCYDTVRAQVTSRVTTVQIAQNVAQSRRSRLAFPPTQTADIFGSGHVIGHVVADAHRALQHLPQIHLPDVRRFLKTELESAYDFLTLDKTSVLWNFCDPKLKGTSLAGQPGLASGIIGRKRWLHEAPVQPHPTRIDKIRRAYFNEIIEKFPRAQHTATVSLAWAILVESALLNEHLIKDMHRVAVERDCDCMAGGRPKFYLPKLVDADGQPSQEFSAAAEAFNRYVRCRWPIHVFALDPVSQDQNVADVFSRRRELQLAAAVAVAKGDMSTQAAGRFARRLELDMETIALNRTQVAFSHGNDTFGWRFYPRVQTPPTPGTLEAFAETVLGGPSREKDLRARELEPGIRECTAIIIMPSFVQNVKFSTRANWFGLTNPRKKELTLHDSIALGRNHQAIKQSMYNICNCGSYRPADIAGLRRTVDQLERRMPLQEKLVQVPHENTLGGFEMFSVGVTDLAPELIGWYGAPGINADGTTTIFMVGDNFSVHDTRLIVGGQHVEYRLLSRQILEAKIPPGSRPAHSVGKYSRLVDVHLATPYGISSHVFIPLIKKSSGSGPLTWNPDEYQLKVMYKLDDNGLVVGQTSASFTFPLTMKLDSSTPAVPKTFTLAMVIRDSNGKLLSETSANATYSVGSRKYVIADITAAINSAVNGEFRNNTSPIGDVTWRVSATFSGGTLPVDVNGQAALLLKFEEKP